jgi:creatinine amidohydrolase
VILLPIGSTEQHGHHLPLDTDNLLATEVSLEAARRDPRNLLVMPNIPYGYNEHAQDFPGTIHVTYEHFIEYCIDVCKSVAYGGFKRIVIVDGHLVAFCKEFKAMTDPVRVDHRAVKPQRPTLPNLD